MAAATAPYGTNASAYNGLAREVVIFGPGSIDQAHRDIEWIETAEATGDTTLAYALTQRGLSAMDRDDWTNAAAVGDLNLGSMTLSGPELPW